jgi:hypothetical protein
MARKRMVSPDLLTSEKVAEMPIPSRYAWVALWLYLDDFGYGRDSAKLVKAHTWPLDEYATKKVESDLGRFFAAGLLCRYELVDGTRWMHAPNWDEHQKPQHPTPTKAPPCPVHAREAHEAYRELTEGLVNPFRVITEGLRHRVVELNTDKGSSSDLGLSGPALVRESLRNARSA